MRAVCALLIIAVVVASCSATKVVASRDDATPTWPSRWIWEFQVSFSGPMSEWTGFGTWYTDWTTNSWRLDEMMRVSVAVPGIPEPFPFMTTWSGPANSAYQMSYMDGNTSCSGFPWFAWPSQILKSKYCSAGGAMDFKCKLCYNDTLCISAFDLTVDSKGFPKVATFTDLGEVFTTTAFYEVASFDNNIFAVPPSCTVSASLIELADPPICPVKRHTGGCME